MIGTHKTTVSTDNGMTSVVYHNTPIVKFNHERIILDTGGWHTATTKKRMNQTSYQHDLGYRVYQKDYEWFVAYKDEILNFADNMTLTR